MLFDSPQRFAIDRNIKKPTCYKVTQNDTSSYNYGKGLCCVTVSEIQLNRDTDKLIPLPDGTQVWICDYTLPSTPLPSPPLDETPDIKISITGNPIVRIGFKRTYTAVISTNNGYEIDWDDTSYEWNIESSFLINKNIDGNKIEVLVNDETLIEESFLLQVIDKNNQSILSELRVTVKDVV